MVAKIGVDTAGSEPIFGWIQLVQLSIFNSSILSLSAPPPASASSIDTRLTPSASMCATSRCTKRSGMRSLRWRSSWPLDGWCRKSIQETSDGPFSAVSTPIFATKCSFCSVFRVLQDFAFLHRWKRRKFKETARQSLWFLLKSNHNDFSFRKFCEVST